MSVINLALLGAAHIHTPGFIKTIKARSNDVMVKTVWDHDAARGQARADELDARYIGDLNTILHDPEIKGAIVCSETNRHEELVIPAAQAGKHLFVEKPLGMGSRDAYAMADAIERAGVMFQTGYFQRGVPAHLFIKEQIARGSFGKITRIRGSNCHGGSINGWFDKEWRWMADPKQAGCGAFGDLGTHSLDIMLWLMGDVDRVTAQLDPVTARYGKDCDETGEALLRFANGAIGTLAAGWVDVANPVRLLISGTEGHAAVINDQLYYASKNVEGADGKTPWTKDLPPEKRAGLDAFLDAVTGKDATLVTAREAAYRSAVMEAIYESARRGDWRAPAGKSK